MNKPLKSNAVRVADEGAAMLERVQALQTLLQDNVDKARTERRVPVENIEALQEALAKYGKPEIFNTDQGSQFTSKDFTDVLKAHEIDISMDGKGAWRDNVFVERIWKSVKYEEVYLHAYDSVGQARTSLGRYLDFYNSRRPHSSLDRQPPDRAYFNRPSLLAAA